MNLEFIHYGSKISCWFTVACLSSELPPIESYQRPWEVPKMFTSSCPNVQLDLLQCHLPIKPPAKFLGKRFSIFEEQEKLIGVVLLTFSVSPTTARTSVQQNHTGLAWKCYCKRSIRTQLTGQHVKTYDILSTNERDCHLDRCLQ